MEPIQPLALTMGEPAGIGPDITLAAYAAGRDLPDFVVIGEPEILRRRAAALGLEIPIETVASPAEAVSVFGRALPVIDLEQPCPCEPGRLDPAAAALVTGAIEAAVTLTLTGETSAVVTNPIHKKNLYDAGFAHPGHTEFLAALSASGGEAPRPVMMLAAGGLKVVPVTVHIPLAAVPGALSSELIVEVAAITAQDLKARFGIGAPRLAVAGLNPHAGEDGGMGREDIEIIAPAIARLRQMGIDAIGPLPADTMFHAEARAGYDAALGMYHDQALIPVKTLDFHGGVNTTLGLPLIRTSPDHGTALELAASGKANPSSLMAALEMAAAMVRAERSGA